MGKEVKLLRGHQVTVELVRESVEAPDPDHRALVKDGIPEIEDRLRFVLMGEGGQSGAGGTIPEENEEENRPGGPGFLFPDRDSSRRMALAKREARVVGAARIALEPRKENAPPLPDLELERVSSRAA